MDKAFVIVPYGFAFWIPVKFKKNRNSYCADQYRKDELVCVQIMYYFEFVCGYWKTKLARFGFANSNFT